MENDHMTVLVRFACDFYTRVLAHRLRNQLNSRKTKKENKTRAFQMINLFSGVTDRTV